MTPSVPDFSKIFQGILNLSLWEQYHIKEDFAYNGIPIPGLRQDVYKRTVGNEIISVGVFYYNGVQTYIAWGPKAAKHCAWHARITADGTISDVQLGCPNVVPKLSDTGAVIGFDLDGETVQKEN